MKCIICNKTSKEKLCRKHSKLYIWDSKLQGYRLKKRNTGSRYTQSDYHKTETKLVKLVEHICGKSDVVTSFHPKWALSPKKVLYEYDIYIPSKGILIEYNGRQHYEFVEFFHRKIANFNKQVYRDRLKKQLAINNGYKLITIKYDEPITKGYISSKIRG